MKRKWLFRFLALCLVGGICWLLVGITINIPPKSPLQKLNDARALWQARGSRDYQMDIGFGAALSRIYNYRIVVHKNSVTAIYNIPFYPINADSPTLGSTDGILAQDNSVAQAIAPDLKDYTVEKLFSITTTKLASQTLPELISFCSISSISPFISFNSEYGYIESYDLGNCPKWEIGGGLMCPQLSDCYAGMRVRNFQILPPSP